MARSDFPAICDEDMLERMLMSSCERSESANFCHEEAYRKPALGDKNLGKRLGKLGRNIKGAVSAFKHALALDVLSRVSSKEQCRKAVWSGVLKSLTELYPGSQLPDKLISTLRTHFDSLPLSYFQAGFDIEQVFHHARLLEQVANDGHCHPVVSVQEHVCEINRSSNASELSSSSSLCTSACSEEEEPISIEAFKLAFACKSTMSRPALTLALENAGIGVKQLHLFEKRCITLGVAIVQCNKEFSQTHRMQAAIQAAIKKSRAAKLTLGLCGCEGRGSQAAAALLNGGTPENFEMQKSCTIVGQDGPMDFDACSEFSVDHSVSRLLGFSSPGSLHQIVTDERQMFVFGKTALESCLLDSTKLQVGETIAVGSSGTVCKAYYNGEMVAVKKLRGCEGGRAIDVELRKDVLGLVSCQHENVLLLRGICVDSRHGMCLVMKHMEGGSLFDAIQKYKRMQLANVIRIAMDISEGMVFLHERGIVHRDLKSSGILLDGEMRAVIGDLGLVNDQNIESGQYEVGSYRWMAPEVLGTDPECSIVTFMSNVYSFGIILWEMITCQIPYVGYSPVKGAVGVAAYGLRPTMPSDCPLQLKHLLERCWASCPLDRPNFFEVLEVLRTVAMELLPAYSN